VAGRHRRAWGYRGGCRGSKILFDSHPAEDAAHFGTGTKGADLDEGDGPSGETGDLADGTVFEFEKGEDQAGGGGELGKGMFHEGFGGVGISAGIVRGGGVFFEPVGFIVRQVGHGLFAIALVGAEDVVADADGDAHEPMFEGGIGAPGVEVLEDPDEDLLDGVGDLVLVTGVASGSGKQAWLIAGDDLLETSDITGPDGGDDFGVGRIH